MRLKYIVLLAIPFLAGCQCDSLCQYKAGVAQSAPRGGNIYDLEMDEIKKCVMEMDAKGIRGDARIPYNRKCRHLE